MRGPLRTGIAVTAAITAAVTLYLASTLPAASIALDGQPPPTHIPGAYHIHTNRSDGTGTVDDVAAAAARAGLRFVILTDHGDGTREPDPPAYRHGVLTIDAVEINTRQGHLVALGLDEATPYPLAGLAADVIEDVHRLGGVAIAAHPDSPRAELAWRGGPGGGVALDGFEWINADSEWRDDVTLTLLTRAVQSIVRGPESVAALFSRPARSLQRWDNAARQRPTFGLAAVDAHANIGWREDEEPRQRTLLRRPSYETLFRTLVQTAVVDAGLSGDARTDADRLVAALAGGRSYSTVRAHAWPSALEFTARQGDIVHQSGARITETGVALTFHASVTTAPGARIVLMRDGQAFATGQGQLVATGITAPGAYRVEARLSEDAVPWIVSNPIVIASPSDPDAGPAAPREPPTPAPAPAAADLRPLDDAARWNIEHDPASTGSIEDNGDGLRFDYRLGSGIARGQYAAAAHGDDGEDGIETIRFVARASAPMRLSVQVRLPEGRGRGAQRWRRSIYLDQAPRTFTLHLRDFEPADRPTARRPIVTPIHSVLFVVDTVNTRPGAAGTVWLSDVALGVNRLDQ